MRWLLFEYVLTARKWLTMGVGGHEEGSFTQVGAGDFIDPPQLLPHATAMRLSTEMGNSVSRTLKSSHLLRTDASVENSADTNLVLRSETFETKLEAGLCNSQSSISSLVVTRPLVFRRTDIHILITKMLYARWPSPRRNDRRRVRPLD